MDMLRIIMSIHYSNGRIIMKKRIYEGPEISVVYLPDEDVLTLSTPDHVFSETDTEDSTVGLPTVELFSKVTG